MLPRSILAVYTDLILHPPGKNTPLDSEKYGKYLQDLTIDILKHIYPIALKLKSTEKNNLHFLDLNKSSSLSKLLFSKKHLTTSQLVDIMLWKMARGTWRPRLEKLSRSNPDSSTQKISHSAFKLITTSVSGRGRWFKGVEAFEKTPLDVTKWTNNLKSAINLLTQLSGVGPATTGAILSTYDPHIPYFDKIMYLALHPTSSKPKYTTNEFTCFSQEIWTSWNFLPSPCLIFPQDISNALWCLGFLVSKNSTEKIALESLQTSSLPRNVPNEYSIISPSKRKKS